MRVVVCVFFALCVAVVRSVTNIIRLEFNPVGPVTVTEDGFSRKYYEPIRCIEINVQTGVVTIGCGVAAIASLPDRCPECCYRDEYNTCRKMFSLECFRSRTICNAGNLPDWI